MKNRIAFFVLLLGLLLSSTASGDVSGLFEKSHQLSEKLTNTIENIKKENETYGGIDKQGILSVIRGWVSAIEEIENESVNLRRDCENEDHMMNDGARYYTSYSWCYDYCYKVNKIAAETQIMIAGTFVRKGFLDDAKNLYRKIITVYTGTAYLSYVKQAEFGLEDIKAMEANLEKEKAEQERLKKAMPTKQKK